MAKVDFIVHIFAILLVSSIKFFVYMYAKQLTIIYMSYMRVIIELSIFSKKIYSTQALVVSSVVSSKIPPTKSKLK